MGVVISGPSSGVSITEQVVLSVVAGVVLSGHRLVTPMPDGRVAYASCANPGHVAAPLWLTTASAATDAVIEVVISGEVTEPSWAWQPGAIYLGENGALTQVLPSAPTAAFIAQVGSAVGPTTAVFDRFPSIRII